MNILLLTDFSSNASHAHRYVLQLYKDQHVNSFLLHVKRPCVSSEKCSGKCKLGLFQKLKNQAKDLIEHSPDSEPTPVLVEGSFIEEVRAAVIRYQIDVLVIGAKGKSTHSKIIGSHPQAIATKVKCPSFIIFEDTVIQTPKSALFPVNYTDALYPVCLNKLKDLPAWENLSLKILELKPSAFASRLALSSKEILEKSLKSHSIEYLETAKTEVNLTQESNAHDLLIFASKNLSVGNQIFTELKNISSQGNLKTPLFVLHA